MTRLLNPYVISATMFVCMIGLTVRVYFAATQPLWLDEQFSLFFSHEYELSQLVFFFSKDVHPGLYYSFVKIISFFSPSNFVLRLITSVLPEFIGFGMLTKTLTIVYTHFFRVNKKFNKIANQYLVLIFTFLYFLNPFIIDQSWQIRMYGVILLLASISLYFFVKFITAKKAKYLVYVFLICLAGMATSYTFFLFSFSLLTLLILWMDSKMTKKIFLLIFSLLFFGGYFFVLSGYSGRGQIEYANWISHPNVLNIPSTYTTLFGFGTNVHASPIRDTFQLFSDYVLFFTSLFFLFCIFKFSSIFSKSTYSAKANRKIAIELFVGLFIIPVTTILLGSFLLPFLSNRFFFYTFIPNISLFLPRIHTPFLPLFWIVLTIALFKIFLKLTHLRNNKIVKFILPILIFFLVFSVHITTIRSIYTLRLETSRYHNGLKQSHEKSELIFPEWIHYIDIIDTTYLSTHQQLPIQIITSKKMSIQILSETQNCSVTQEKSFAIFPAFFTKGNEKEKLVSYYEACCPEDKKMSKGNALLCK